MFDTLFYIEREAFILIRVGIVGCGNIFKTQIAALNKMSDKFIVTSICDINPDVLQKITFISNKHTDLEEFLENKNIDIVVVSTPPNTHYELAKKIILKKKNLILEKPAVLDYSQLEELYALADTNKVFFYISFHFCYSSVLQWFIENKNNIIANKNIKEIVCEFFDPYMSDINTLYEKSVLGGCYFDSGVNAISACSKLVNLNDFHIVSKRVKTKPPYNINIDSEYCFSSAYCKLVIRTKWTKDTHSKSIRIALSDNEYVILDDANQLVVYYKNNISSILFEDKDKNRLLNHYIGMFQDFEHMFLFGITNKETSLAIHRLLLSE